MEDLLHLVYEDDNEEFLISDEEEEDLFISSAQDVQLDGVAPMQRMGRAHQLLPLQAWTCITCANALLPKSRYEGKKLSQATRAAKQPPTILPELLEELSTS